MIEHQDQYLVEESFDSVKEQIFFMPFGGGVEFGESAREAVIREVKEELSIDIPKPDLLTVIENRFHFEGKPGHEIVFVFTVRLEESFDRSIIVPEILNGRPLKLAWLTADDIATTESPVYPEGFVDAFASYYTKSITSLAHG